MAPANLVWLLVRSRNVSTNRLFFACIIFCGIGDGALALLGFASVDVGQTFEHTQTSTSDIHSKRIPSLSTDEFVVGRGATVSPRMVTAQQDTKAISVRYQANHHISSRKIHGRSHEGTPSCSR